MALPESFDLKDSQGTVVAHGALNNGWVVLDYFAPGQEDQQALMRPGEFDAVRASLPPLANLALVAT